MFYRLDRTSQPLLDIPPALLAPLPQVYIVPPQAKTTKQDYKTAESGLIAGGCNFVKNGGTAFFGWPYRACATTTACNNLAQTIQAFLTCSTTTAMSVTTYRECACVYVQRMRPARPAWRARAPGQGEERGSFPSCLWYKASACPHCMPIVRAYSHRRLS